MQELTGEGLCSAHHGLSLVVTARLGSQERTVLFDAGPDPYALERSVRRMGLDFEKIEAVVLSHGHLESISNRGLMRPSSEFPSPVRFAFPDTSERRSPGVGH